jgi:hypothetical protein
MLFQASASLAQALSVAGPLCFIGIQCSSVKTALDILKLGNVSGMSPLPFASLLTNGVVWTLYGLLKMDKTILYPNALSILTGFGCTSIYYSQDKKDQTNVYIGVLGMVALAAWLFIRKDAAMLGLIGCAMAVSVVGTPLAAMGTVLKEKSTASLPFGRYFLFSSLDLV